MSIHDQAAIDASWGEAVARVSPRSTHAAILPQDLRHDAGRLQHDSGAGAGASLAAVDAWWSAAVAKVNAEEGLKPGSL